MYSVYKISIGNYFYIGCSKRVNKRITAHQWKLKNNRHKNQKLSEAFNKSAEFDWEILHEVEEKKEAFKTERTLIKKEKANKYCCNVQSNEEHHLKGYEHSKASREKMSKSKTGIPRCQKTKDKMRQTYLNSNTIHHCPYCDKSSKNAGGMSIHIRYCKHKPQEL